MSANELIDETPRTLREEELQDLGFAEDDDEPTQMLVDPRVPSKKSSTILPPRVDEGDVYLLTEQHLRYKAGIVPMDDERVDMHAILRAAPSLPPQAAPEPEIAAAPVQRANSLSPVAMSAGDITVPPVPMTARTRPHPVWPATLAVLSVAAIGVLFIRPSSSATAASAAGQPPVVMAQAEHTPVAATGTGSLDLPEIAIEVAPTTVVAPQVPGVQAAVAYAGPVPAAGPAAEAPAIESERADAPSAEATPAAEELPPPAPPEEPVAPPFNRSSAAAALDSAVGAALACRDPGIPTAPVSMRVTFAPTGSVTIAVVENAPYAGTSAGGCIARTFRSAKVAPFSGTPVTVHKTFQLN